MSHWQPMETAPRDGTEIAGYRADQGVFVFRWAWMEEFVPKSRSGDPTEDYDDDVEGWWHDRWGWMEGDETPTHWMPLPAPPAAAPTARTETGGGVGPRETENSFDEIRAALQASEARAREAEGRVTVLEKAAEDIEALIDEQTYDERRRADFDMPDDAELCVMVPARVFRKLSAALTARQALTPEPATATLQQGEDVSPLPVEGGDGSSRGLADQPSASRSLNSSAQAPGEGVAE